VDGAFDCLEDFVLLECGAVADVGARAEGQDSRVLSGVVGGDGVTDEEDAAVYPVQSRSPDAVVDRPASQPGGLQLALGDRAAVPSRRVGDRDIAMHNLNNVPARLGLLSFFMTVVNNLNRVWGRRGLLSFSLFAARHRATMPERGRRRQRTSRSRS
jgi:hypothetical protein